MEKKILFFTYQKCKEWVYKKYKKKIVTRYDWNKIKDTLPECIPTNPNTFYKDCGWINWNDFLSISNYYSYNEAKRWINENLKSDSDSDSDEINTIIKWKLNIWKLPDFIPREPDKFYKFTGWISWTDWLNKN